MHDQNQQQPTLSDRAKEHAKSAAKNAVKKKAKKIATKTGKKLIKKYGAAAVKKLITSFFTALMKVITVCISALVAIGWPVIVVALLVIAVYIATSALFSWGSDNLDEGTLAKEFANVVVETANSTVDMSKPEQIKYKVPDDLLTSSAQIYDSLKSTEEKELSDEELFEHEVSLIRITAEALKPSFVYEDITLYDETESEICGPDGACTTNIKKDEYKVPMLKKVEAWDRIVNMTNTVQVGEWSGHSTDYHYEDREVATVDELTGETKIVIETVVTTITTRTRSASSTSSAIGKIDYTRYDKLLKKAFDYTENDLLALEGIYKTLGNTVQSSADYGVGGGFNFDVRGGQDITAAQVNAGLSGLLAGRGQTYVSVGRKYGINPAFLGAITMAETGGNSKALREKNNVGGLMKSKGGLRTFPSIEASIDYLGDVLNRLYIMDGLITVEQIQKRYAPDAAANDPTNLNSNWVTNVYGFMNRMGVALSVVADPDEKDSEMKSPGEEANAGATPGDEEDEKDEEKEEEKTNSVTESSIENPIFYKEWLEGKEIPFFEDGTEINSNTGSVDISDMELSRLGLILPTVNSPKTSGYGPRNGKLHAGIDLAARPKNSAVPNLAVADGVVSESRYSDSYGEVVRIKHQIRGQVYESLYAHMRSGTRSVQVGQQVKQGAVLGIQGTTGRSSGQHLHFEFHVGSWTLGKENSINPELVLPPIK